MSKTGLRILLAFCLGAAVVLVGSVIAAEKGDSYKGTAMSPQSDCASSIRILPPEVSKSLKISRIPTPEPIPLLIATYWNCKENDQGLEICDLTTVVCTDDQRFCTQIP